MQVKTQTAEEMNMKRNEAFKILMAIAAFQMHCKASKQQQKTQLISKGILWIAKLIPWRTRKTETKNIQQNRFIFMNRECEIIDTESAHSLGLETAVATD